MARSSEPRNDPRIAASAFVPAHRPRVAVATDGSVAAILEPSRVTVVELPTGTAGAEIGIDPESGASDVGWLGSRLLVLSRYAAHSTVHLIDPSSASSGARTIAEIRLEAPMKLFATAGNYALAVGSIGAAVLAASDAHLTPYQFPARTMPVAAGAAGNQFVVALAGSVEEWDPQSRMPKRKLKLPRPAVITAVGGSERAVWLTTQSDPTRIEVLPLVNRGQPKAHELPEPIAYVASHPRSDLLACIGVDTGRLYVVDLDGRAALRAVTADGIDRVEAASLVVGRMLGILVAQTKRPLAFVSLDGREPESAPLPSLPIPREPDPPPSPSTLVDPPPAPVAEEPAAKPSLFRPPMPAPAAPPVVVKAAVPTPIVGPSLSERFSTWRTRMRDAQPRATESAGHAFNDQRPSWRDEAAGWARAVASGSLERDAPPAPAIDVLVERFELSPQLVPALVLLYGAHLAGEQGAAPIDIARVLGRRWDEALGTGQLAARGVAVYRDSRVRLAPAVQRALDELPVRTGTMVGEPGQLALLGPCCVVAADGPLGVVAEAWLASVGSAILAAHPHADPHELVLEARAYGAAPMLRISGASLARIPTDEPVVLVVSDDATADQLGVPRLS